MAQSLLIGLGGTGSRVVNNVVKELKRQNKTYNNGEICCAVLDTNKNDNEKIIDSGTGVPVFGTSKPQKIREYFRQYAHKHIEEWCPQSPAFDDQTMIDGASEVRSKSRLAFFDSLESGVMRQLELMINDVLQNNNGSKIRVMIVSSLSGGTGSGMFIQVALWLRKILSQSQITIRGIFLLPDVFIDNIHDIRKSPATRTRHYANAYAAIRELNTITKIKKSGISDLSNPITLDSLFDSRKDAKSGVPVFDFAFFVDNQDQNGVRLKSMEEYEKMVAQLVYMQLYAPMVNDMYSEEDNAFLEFTRNAEPLYGSCGASEAVYPFENVLDYCVIRASLDSVQNGWKRLDGEIESIEDEKRLAQKDGYYTSDKIDVPTEYIRLFEEKTSVKPEQAGRDMFFIRIAHDVKNEATVSGSDGKPKINYSDKIPDFLKLLKTKKIDTYVTQYGNLEDMKIDPDRFSQADHTKTELQQKCRSDFDDLEEILNTFENNADTYASTIVNSVFPLSMGDVTPRNPCSIYGLLSKPNEKGAASFVHPVAARYLLYKLIRELERGLKTPVQDSKYSALSEEAENGTLDNKRTKATENTVEAALGSVRRPNRPSSFDEFEKQYAEFFNTKVDFAIKYETELLMIHVYAQLLNRVKGLLEYLTNFFKRLDDVQKELRRQLEKNIKETETINSKTIYVYAKQNDKERIYNTLDLEFGEQNSAINRSVIDAAYGRYCAKKRPSEPNNKPYHTGGIVANFLADTRRMYREGILDESNKPLIDLDIYTAICREADSEKKKEATEADDSFVYNFESDRIEETNSDTQRYTTALTTLVERLDRMATPFLVRETEVANNTMGITTSREKRFWGFHPNMVKACPNLGTYLGINAVLQANSAYEQNVLCCYRAVYGLEVKYIPKFNESSDGIYYTSYKSVIEEMTEAAEGALGEEAYVSTPHLDKRWHRFLQYSSSEMNKQVELDLYYGLWLAVAYGKLQINKDGNFVIKRSIDGGFGTIIDEEMELLDGNKPIGKTQIAKLLVALKTDPQFISKDVSNLKKRLNEDLEEMDTYVGTEVLKGLTTKKTDINPIVMVCRLSESRKANTHDAAKMIGALEHIAEQLADHYNVQRSIDQLEKAKYRVCKKMYDSASRKEKASVFSSWVEAFNRCKIKMTEATEK